MWFYLDIIEFKINFKDNSNSIYYYFSGWVSINANLPEGIRDSCAVTLDDTSVLLIGGNTASTNFTSSTYLFKSDTTQWFAGSPLRVGRRATACGIIR